MTPFELERQRKELVDRIVRVGANVRRGHLVVTRDLFLACPPETRAQLLAAMQAMDNKATSISAI